MGTASWMACSLSIFTFNIELGLVFLNCKLLAFDLQSCLICCYQKGVNQNAKLM